MKFMAEFCYNCFKPKACCLCSYTKEMDSGIKFVLLMHPKEAKKNRTGTGHIARISLTGCEIIMGLDFAENKRLQELLHDHRYFPMMMFPGPEAWTAKKEGFKETLGGRIPLPIILDSTWWCAKKMIQHNPFLLDLPRLSFYGDYRSIYTFKKEPEPEYISTVESCYYLIKEFQDNGITDKNVNPEPMMDAFKAMIKFQLQAENERILGLRPNVHQKDAKYSKLRDIPDFK